MVPAARILEKAIEIDADLIGLSGLITPSLDEMTHVAAEMERQGFTIPLLIGGATTSRTHTAVKIAPAYSGPVVHVVDASRAVGVAGALVEPDRRDAFVAGIRDEYETVRRERAGTASQGAAADPGRGARQPPADRLVGGRPRRARPSSACARSTTTRWPSSCDVHRLDAVLRDLGAARRVSRRSWTTRASGRRRASSTAMRWRCSTGSSARAGCTRTRSSASGRPTPSDDDIVVWRDDGAARSSATFRTLRQQMAKPDGRPNLALADFVAPVGAGRRRLHRRLRGDRPATASTRSSPSSRRPTTTTRPILAKALADRLAEAFAERLHERVRRELWGYAPDEALGNADLIAERYQGIRPAPGYPACPDHTEKGTLFDLLEAESRAGIRLTESFAMWPGASVSGLLPVAPRQPLLRRRPDRSRPAGGLRRPEGHAPRRGRALAGPEPADDDETAAAARPCRRRGVTRAGRGVRRVPGPARPGRRRGRGHGTSADPRGEWGPTEIVRHLIAVEAEVWQSRLARVAAEDDPHWSWTEPGLAPGFDDAPLHAIVAAFARRAPRPSPRCERSTTTAGLASGRMRRTAGSTSTVSCASRSTTTPTTSRASAQASRRRPVSCAPSHAAAEDRWAPNSNP